jgi:hypothetical protein
MPRTALLSLLPLPLRGVCALWIALAACSPETRPDPGFNRDAAAQGGSGGRAGRSGSGGDAGTDGGGGDGGSGGDSGTGGAGGMSGGGAGDAGTAGDGGDAGDAGACASACDGDTPVCDPSTGGCVECLRAEDCDDGDLCSDAHTCIECTRNEHCDDPSASHCNTSTNRCEGCLSEAHCAHLEATPECDERTNRCGACTDDTEAERCGTFSCSRADLVCTTTQRGSRLACQACQADSECGSNFRCVEQFFGQGASRVSLGSFCFFRKGGVGCAAEEEGRRPYSEEVDTRSVDRVQDVYCLPITSCAAIVDATDWNGAGGGAKSCENENVCGVANLSDGHCLASGPGMGKCSYLCINEYQCPGIGFVHCSGAPGRCEPAP